ncbi:MAG: beta strand repeat-containing protein [Longimicrobiaceae bacterium]
MQRLKRAAGLAAILVAAACTADAISPTAPAGPRETISDAAHSGAVPGFYFLPPMVPQPTYSGTFDAALQPRVEICELSGSACVTTIATFTFGTGASNVKLDAAGQQYQVNWKTSDYNLDPAKTYRISVYQGTFRLGYADVDVVGAAKDLKNVDTNQYIPLLDDRTLPIKFRIETGIPAVVTVSPALDSIYVGETAQFTAACTDLHGNTVACPATTWSSSDTNVATVDGTGLATGVNQGTVTITASIGYAQGTATLVVVQPNTPPVANPDSFDAIGNVTVPVAAPGVLANDTDTETPSGLSVVPGTVATANGGTATLAADGSFTYLSAPGAVGVDSFTYTVTDGSLTASATVTMTSTYRVWYVDDTGTAPGDGRDASPFTALTSAESASSTGETIFLRYGSGTYGTGFTFQAGQSLTGQGVPVDVTVVLNGQTVTLLQAGSTPMVTRSSGTTVTLASNNVAQGFNVNSVAGAGIAGSGFGTFVASDVEVAATGGPSLDLQGGTVSAAFTSLSSTTSAGAGLHLDGVGGTLTAPAGLVTGAFTYGVDVVGGGANVTYGGSISGSGARAARVMGRTGGALVLTGNITDAGGGILVQSNLAGTISFNGASKSIATGASNAVTLSSNTGATINFGGGGLNLTTTGGTGFSAAGGGTVNVTGANNVIAVTGGTALSVVNTGIGASGLSFRSITASGDGNGIVLNNTGSTNGLQVTGDGSNTQNGSGGSISGTSGAAVSATGVTNLVLRSMELFGMSGNAVDVSNSSGVQLTAVHVYQPGAGGVVGSNLTGSNSIEKSLLDYAGSAAVNVFAVRLANSSTNGALTLDGTTVQNKLDAGAAVSVSGQGSSVIAFTVRDSNTGDGFESKFTNLAGSAIAVLSGDNAGSTAQVTVRVSDTKFVNAAANGINNLDLNVSQNAVLNYVIRDNLFDAVGKASAIAGVINLGSFDAGQYGASTAADSIVGNTIRNLGTGSLAAQLGYLGIRVAVDNTTPGIPNRVVIKGNTIENVWRQGVLVSGRTNVADLNVRIEGNTVGTAANPVGRSNRRGVEVEAQSSAVVAAEVLNNGIVNAGASGTNSALAIRSLGSTSTLNATVLGNTIASTNTATNAARFRAETVSGTTAKMCLDLRNNSLDAAARLFEVQANSTGVFNVEGPGTAVVTNADITAANTVGTGSVLGSPTFSNGVNCPQPSL